MRSPRMTGRTSLLLLVALSTLACAGPGQEAGEPALRTDAARASRPIAGTSQIVLTIHNDGDGVDRLIEATTDVALAVEIHRTELTADGRAVMRGLQEVELAAGSATTFRPGGLHLMLVVPDESVVLGGTFDLTLRFQRSAPLTLPVRVVEPADLLEDLND
jgi:copper(I)-binding protein